MAYKPSMRRSGQSADIELDIKPVMNLMVVLIPLLLAGVEMVKLSIIEFIFSVPSNCVLCFFDFDGLKAIGVTPYFKSQPVQS